MFESLPKADDALASHYGEGDNRGGNGADQGRGYNAGRWYDFYGANLQRLYGDPCVKGSDTKAGVAAAAKADAVEATATRLRSNLSCLRLPSPVSPKRPGLKRR